MKNLMRIILVAIISSSFSNVYAEQSQTHKHYKATMKGASHGDKAENSDDQEFKENPQHKHHKATMPGESHKDFVEGNYPKSTTNESSPTHKHHKATMKGEKHNQKD